MLILNSTNESLQTVSTKLTNQLGNYTVKKSVPSNAVFTDTTYDFSHVTASSNGSWARQTLGGFTKILNYISTAMSITTNTAYGNSWFADVSITIPVSVRIANISNVQIQLLSNDGIAYPCLGSYNSGLVNFRLVAPAQITKNYIIHMCIIGN